MTDIQEIDPSRSGADIGRPDEKTLRYLSRYYSGIDWSDLLFHLLEKTHWIVLAALLGAALAGIYVHFFVTPIYQATSKIYIAGSETSISLSDLQLGSSLAKDYQEVFKIWHVHEMVDERLNMDYSYGRLENMVSVSNPEGTHLLYIRVKSDDPEEARMLADTYAEVVQEFIADKMELRKPQLLEKAQLPVRPISPNINGTIRKGFLAAAFLAAAWILLLYLLDDRIRSSEDIEKCTSLATLGVLTHQNLKKNAENRQESLPAPPDPERAERLHQAVFQKTIELDYSGTEAVNAICFSITFAGKNMKRIAVTSHDADNGKSFLTMQIAINMTKRGKNVLVVDGDLRNSVLLSQYGVSLPGEKKGLAHYLSGQCSAKDAIYQTTIPGLYIMPAGAAVKTPIPLLASPDFARLMDVLGKKMDLVLVDTPPIGLVIDAAEIAKSCNGTLLVVESGRTSRRSMQYMEKTMEQTGTPLIGCVLNNVLVKKFSKQYYYYDYGYGYGEDGRRKHRRKKSEK